MTIGIVHDERNAMRPRQVAEPCELLWRQHIAGGIRGTRDSHARDVGRNTELLEIDTVLELVRSAFLYLGKACREHASAQPLIGIADVFRHQGKEDALSSARALARQQV